MVAVMFELSGENPPLAEYEIECILDTYGMKSDILYQENRVLVMELIDSPEIRELKSIFSRLAFTHTVSQYIASFDTDDIKSFTYEVNNVKFRVDAVRHNASHPDIKRDALERIMGNGITGGSVSLSAPEVIFRAIISDRIYTGLLLSENDKSYLRERKPESRPFSKPVSLSPKLARIMVNLALLKQGDKLLDPFCGTGGILIESGFMDIYVEGADADREMIEGAKRNMEHFGIVGETFNIPVEKLSGISADAIVTDPPYGRASSVFGNNINEIYSSLNHLGADILVQGKRMVVMLPGDYTELFSYFNVVNVFIIPVHRSLTRYLTVLERK